MSYNGSGTFQINTSGQPVVAGTVISSTAFNALTADLATGLSTAITKDGQTTTTARIPFAAGINSSLTTDSSSTTTGSIITAGGVGIAKALYVGTTANIAGTTNLAGLTASSAVATDASKNLVSVTNTGTGNNVLATSPTLVTPVLGAASATSITVAAGAVGTPSITTTGDTNTGIFFPAADTIAFSEGGAEAMRIDSDGDVGIGTATPGYKLDVQSSASSGAPLLANFQAAGGDVQVYIQNGTVKTQINADATNSASIIGSFSNHPLSLRTNNTERMRIDSSGNVGIGTTSPSSKLHVVSSSGENKIISEATAASQQASLSLIVQAATPGQTVIYMGKTGATTNGQLGYDPNINAMTMYTNNAERMRIDSSGNLLVGTTTQVGTEQLGIVFSDPSGKGGLGVQVVSAVSGASFAVFRNASGTAIGSITRNTTTNAVLYNTTSDYRLKENVKPLTNALGRVATLKPVQWVWKDCDGAVGEGFIAHEVQDVVPAAVSGKKDAVDAEGNIKPQGMDSSYLVATLTAAIQEQQALITALTARIEALENK